MKSKMQMTDILLIRYAHNECSEEEAEQVRGWIKKNPENAREYKLVNQIMKKDTSKQFTPDTEKALKSVMDRLPAQKKPRSVSGSTWLKVAAVLVVALSVTYWLALKPTNENSDFVQYVYNEENNGVIQLSDGSQIWIKEGTILRVPDSFSKTNRRIWFEGEAYFEIISDPAHPFEIEAMNTTTQVLGTKFLLKAKSEDPEIVLILDEGVVAFNAGKGFRHKKAKLIPGQKLHYDSGRDELEVSRNEDLNHAAWKTGIYRFRNQPLQLILDELQRQYEIKFDQLSDARAKELYTVSFSAKDSRDMAIENLEEAIGFNIDRNGEIYYIDTLSVNSFD